MLRTLSWLIAAACFIAAPLQFIKPGPTRGATLFCGVGAVAILAALRSGTKGTGIPPSPIRGDETQQERDARWTGKALLAFCFIGGGGVGLYGLQHVLPARLGPFAQILGAGLLISCGALLTGGLLGFLFGIPRAQLVTARAVEGESNGGDAPRPIEQPYQVNTNLEQISDWLTKIVVGLGLVNLAKVPRQVREIAAYFGASLGELDGREGVALALLILFGTCGFLLGYLLTRLFLTGAFTRAQEVPTKKLQRILRDVVDQSVTTDNLSDEAQIASIQKIDRAASRVPREALVKQVRDLAKEYEVTRASMTFSTERTRRLDGLVLRMQGLGLQAHDMLGELVASSNDGDRLAAVAFLQMRPDERYLPWLSERFPSETPFIQFHAARAFQKAADAWKTPSWEVLERAVRDALERLPEGRSDSATRAILMKTLDAIRERQNSHQTGVVGGEFGAP